MSDSDVENNKYDLKTSVRALIKKVHPDVFTPPSAPADTRAETTVVQILNSITSSSYSDEWLDLEPGTRVRLFGRSQEPLQAEISLPDSPEQFARTFDYFLKHGVIKEFPDPHLRKPSKERVQIETYNRQFDAMTQRVVDSIPSLDTIEALGVKALAIEMLDPDDAAIVTRLIRSRLVDICGTLTNGFPASYDEFMKTLEKTHQDLSVLPSALNVSSASLTDELAEKWFIKKMRNARSKVGLRILESQLSSFPFKGSAEQAEASRQKISSLIERKINAYFS